MAKTKAQLLARMSDLEACDDAMLYVRAHPSQSANKIGQDCTDPQWMVWFLAREKVDLSAFAHACADRAVRVYAPEALEKAGLSAESAKLRALPEIVDANTTDAARVATRYAASYAAYNAARYAAYYAADAAYYAADAANAARYAAHAAYYAADAAYYAADAASYAANVANAANAAYTANNAAYYAANAAYTANNAANAANTANAAEREIQLTQLKTLWREWARS